MKIVLGSFVIAAGLLAANGTMAQGALFGQPISFERPACLPTGATCYTTFVTGKCCTGWCQCYLDPKTRRCRNTLGQCASNDGSGSLP